MRSEATGGARVADGIPVRPWPDSALVRSSPPLKVLVVPIIKNDVPVVCEWIGTLDLTGTLEH